MFAVHGTLLSCGGLVFFFIMLHFHRKPGIAHWLETRAVGEITVFASMMISLMGIAMIGRFFIRYGTQTFGTAEALEVIGTLAASIVVIWKLYLPPPEEVPEPIGGAVSGASGPSVPTSSSGRKAA